MIPDLIGKVQPQLHSEQEYQAYHALKKSLEDTAFANVLKNTLLEIGSEEIDHNSEVLFQRIREYLLNKKWETFEPLFGLSNDEEIQVQSIVNRVLEFDSTVFARYQKRIHTSLERSKEIRNRLQSTNIENFENYMNVHSTLEEKAKLIHLKRNTRKPFLN